MKKFFEEYGTAVLITFIGIVLAVIIVPNVLGLLDTNLNNSMQTTVDNAKEADGDIVEVDNANSANYLIEYNLNDTTGLNKAQMLGKITKLYNVDTETFTIQEATRDGYNFKGWTVQYKDKGQSCLLDTTNTNKACPTLSSTPKTIEVKKGTERDYYLTANWEVATYKISYEGLEKATLKNKKTTYKTEDETFSLGVPTKTGFTFEGWTSDSIKKAQTDVQITKGTFGDLSFTANWKAKEITLEKKSFSIEYSVSQNKTLTLPTAQGGTGKYTYTIKSGNNKNYFSINGNVLTIKANTPVDSYSIEIQAKDDESEATVNTIMNIQINKATLKTINDLKVGSNGSVTWSNIEDADSYQISFDECKTWKTVNNGYNATEDLTKSVGEKKVYVKAIAKEGGNYNSGSAGNTSVTAYKITVQKDDTNVKSVNGEGIYISGATASLNATFNEGYKLDYWMESSTKSTSETYKYVVTKSATISVSAKGITYYINYNANSGTGTMSKQTLTYGNPSLLSANEFNRNGYDFIGWNTKANGSGTSFKDKASVSNLTTKDGETITLYAQWEESKNNIKVKYVSANTGKEISKTTSTITGSIGETKTVPYINITGYNKPSETKSVKIDGKTSEIKVAYTPIEYTITYRLLGGNITTANPSKYTIETADFTLNKPTRDGYSFAGWTGTGISSATEELTIKKGSTGNKTFTASWKEGATTITLDPNGGTVNTNTIYKEAGSTYGDLEEPLRDGYIFEGWYTKQVDGSKIRYNSIVPTGSITLYAHWTSQSFTVTASLNDGNIDNATSDLSLGMQYGANILKYLYQTPKRDNYDFKGWKVTKGDSSSEQATKLVGTMLTSSSTMPNGDISVEAQWDKSYFTLTIDTNDGKASTTKQVQWGEKLNLSTPTRTGYTFTDWTMNGSSVTSSTTMPTENATVKANWKINTYTLTADLDGGEGASSYTITYNDTILDKLSTPTKEGYTFTGWTIDGNELTSSYKMPAGNKTVKANWDLDPSPTPDPEPDPTPDSGDKPTTE